MTNDKQVAIRLPQEAVARATRLAKVLARRPDFGGFRMTQSAVLRLAVLRGLAVLEAENREGRQ